MAGNGSLNVFPLGSSFVAKKIGCTADNYVAVIDLKTLEVTGHIDIKGADGLAWAVRP